VLQEEHESDTATPQLLHPESDIIGDSYTTGGPNAARIGVISRPAKVDPPPQPPPQHPNQHAHAWPGKTLKNNATHDADTDHKTRL
jgi:hypothetical protein